MEKKTFRPLGAFFVLLFAFSLQVVHAAPSVWSGKVVGVSDGDTVTVMRAGRGVKIRLAEIDCPEKRQPYGRAAKLFTSELCYGKIVTVKPVTMDRYGRVVAWIILPDGENLNELLVVEGFAWQYRKYSRSKRLAQLEADARRGGRGLWREPNPIPPWKWRRGMRVGADTVGRMASTDKAGPYHGNVRSHVFHRPGCRYYDCKSCTAVFKTREEAISAGYRPCRRCLP